KRKSKRFHNVSTADSRGAGTVAMFGHLDSRRRGEQRDRGRYVERTESIPARSHYIKEFAGTPALPEVRSNGLCAHRPGECGDFLNRLTLLSQSCQECCLRVDIHRFVNKLFYRLVDLLF